MPNNLHALSCVGDLKGEIYTTIQNISKSQAQRVSTAFQSPSFFVPWLKVAYRGYGRDKASVGVEIAF